MTISPARACHLRKSAAVTAANASSADERLDATPYELLRQVLGNCLLELKGIQSIEEKIARKRIMLPDFMPWVDGVLAAAAAAEAAGEKFEASSDDIVSQVLIWALDTEDFAKALELGAHVLRYGLALPERFKRTAATMIAEEIAEAALKALGQGGTFPRDVLQSADELTAREDMPDEVRAKLKKAIGLLLAIEAAALHDTNADGPAAGKRAAIAAALEHLRRALALNPRVGVKKDIEKLEREAKRLAELQS